MLRGVAKLTGDESTEKFVKTLTVYGQGAKIINGFSLAASAIQLFDLNDATVSVADRIAKWKTVAVKIAEASDSITASQSGTAAILQWGALIPGKRVKDIKELGVEITSLEEGIKKKLAASTKLEALLREYAE